MKDDLQLLLKSLPPEVAAVIQALQDKVALLTANNQLLQQENKIIRQSQDVAIAAHREIYQENCLLKKQLEDKNDAASSS